MKVAVGGTFNVLHGGHKALIERAFELGDEVVFAISSDSFASSRKTELIPFSERLRRLERYLHDRENWSVEVLEDPLGSGITDPDLNILVVSPGSLHTGKRINSERESRGLPPLRLEVVPYLLAEDFLPISSSRILRGEIDEEGRLLRPLRVGVGSTNPVKINAVRAVIGLFYDRLELREYEVDGPAQPFGDETVRWARERARAALQDNDIGVGIEAGVFERDDGLYDVQYCAILDRGGVMSIGHGSGFRYPSLVAEKVRHGATVGEAFSICFGEEDIGTREGAIGFLTKGRLNREELTRQSVMAAMVPRIRRDLY